jgi:hypothetical protein
MPGLVWAPVPTGRNTMDVAYSEAVANAVSTGRESRRLVVRWLGSLKPRPLGTGNLLTDPRPSG